MIRKKAISISLFITFSVVAFMAITTVDGYVTKKSKKEKTFNNTCYAIESEKVMGRNSFMKHVILIEGKYYHFQSDIRSNNKKLYGLARTDLHLLLALYSEEACPRDRFVSRNEIENKKLNKQQLKIINSKLKDQ